MKLSAQEEYGFRCLIRVASAGEGASVTIPEIGQAEGLSIHYVGKLMRLLRQGKFVKSVRGQAGGYALARRPEDITVAEVLAWLGGRLFEPGFCDQFSGLKQLCTHSIDCSIRSLWRAVQSAVDVALSGITLSDLLQDESAMSERLLPSTRREVQL
ncbi:MAG: transcriptional regulator [Acidobacteria bacterium]|nr:MAG: transcriptional regulator [Acidobacteriota bacterium]